MLPNTTQHKEARRSEQKERERAYSREWYHKNKIPKYDKEYDQKAFGIITDAKLLKELVSGGNTV